MRSPPIETASEETPEAGSESLGGDGTKDSGSDIDALMEMFESIAFPSAEEVLRQAVKPELIAITVGRRTGRKRGYFDDDHHPYRPQRKTLDLISDAKEVLTEYEEYLPITVRQILYRLVETHGYQKSEYGRLADHLVNARRGGLISFDDIRDDEVSVAGVHHYADADAFWSRVRTDANRYQRDKQSRQDHYLEVWCESAGMIPQLARVANRYSVEVWSCGGFDSLSAKKDLADRIVDIGKPTIILHLGDLDASGGHIVQAIAEDVTAFVNHDRWVATNTVEFRRVALTVAQVEALNLPTKLDGGGTQLEALRPDVIARLLEDAITDLFDLGILADDIEESDRERRQIYYSLPSGDA